MKLKKHKQHRLHLHLTNTDTPYHNLAKYRMIDISSGSTSDSSKS